MGGGDSDFGTGGTVTEFERQVVAPRFEDVSKSLAFFSLLEAPPTERFSGPTPYSLLFFLPLAGKLAR